MKFNKFIILFGACTFALFTLNEAQTDSTPTDSAQPESRSRGLFDFVMNPLRSTFDHARKFFNRRTENALDGVDSIRMETYKIFMHLYNKTYSPSEIPHRMSLFFQRREEIEESQRLFEEGRVMFAMRENEYVDWEDEELKKLTGVSLPKREEMDPDELEIENDSDELNARTRRAAESAPAEMDWRQSGCVSTPINQRSCGACYAIATMSVVETMRCLNHVSSPILSPQQIVDCATSRAGYQNYGCDGGWPTRVLKYLQDTGIAAREKCYPFVRRQNSCKLNQVKKSEGCTVSASFSNDRVKYKILRNERDVLYHVAKTGPVVTVMKASDKFLYYGKGIFDDTRCSNKRDDVDHAIVIVGYGSQNGADYWIIKNSWGTTEWGIDGYGLYARGKNACSIGHWGWVVTG